MAGSSCQNAGLEYCFVFCLPSPRLTHSPQALLSRRLSERVRVCDGVNHTEEIILLLTCTFCNTENRTPFGGGTDSLPQHLLEHCRAPSPEKGINRGMVLPFLVVPRRSIEAQTKEKVAGSPRSRAKEGGSKAPELMLTWEVLRSIYPTHTYHMEDNAAYRDIVVTRNLIAKVGRGASAALLAQFTVLFACCNGVFLSTRGIDRLLFFAREPLLGVHTSEVCTKLTSFAIALLGSR